MKIQLWSCQYDPEPLGIAPISKIWAHGMKQLGHEVEVVAAHPHYPSPEWGHRLTPYREVRDGIPVTRLPLKIGRKTKRQRLVQELSYLSSLTVSSPFLGTPDALVAVSPSFPALLPAILNTRVRRIPWILWLQDILPDGAASTGYFEDEDWTYRLSRRLEDKAYGSAGKVVVLSDSFRTNLVSKGVPASKIQLAYNPATLPVETRYKSGAWKKNEPRIVCMGNIGKSQNLESIVRAFEADERLAETGARLVITGTGVAEAEVRQAAQTDRVEMLGLVSDETLEVELGRAHLGIVTQSYEGGEFNVPSKLMNYLAIGLPTVASVSPCGEVAGIIDRSGGGWTTDHKDLGQFSDAVADALADPTELDRRSKMGHQFALENLTQSALASGFERTLSALTGQRPSEMAI